MRQTKKAIIRKFLERERPETVGPREVFAIRGELRKALGAGGRVSDRYLLDVLEESGVRVDSALGGLPAEFLAILHFDTLAGAEGTLEELEARRQAAETAGDLAGLENCRRAGRRARERSALVEHNPRVHPAVRRERAEIAAWFVVWLQAPEAFASWLELRKKTREFLERFAV